MFGFWNNCRHRGKIVDEYQRQRVDSDGYIVNENWVTVELDGKSYDIKKPEPVVPLTDKDGEILRYVENPDYRKFHETEKKQRLSYLSD